MAGLPSDKEILQISGFDDRDAQPRIQRRAQRRKKALSQQCTASGGRENKDREYLSPRGRSAGIRGRRESGNQSIGNQSEIL